MAMSFKYNKNANIGRAVTKIVGTLIALWVGGTIITEIGEVMNCTSSPFYEGLNLIGWTITDSVVDGGAGNIWCNGSALTDGATYNNVVTDTSGSGILAVIGIIGIASVALEFISIKF